MYVNVFTGIQMVSARRGWAVGGKGVIVGTEDGTHWTRQYADPEALVSLDAVDFTHAWAVGQRHLLGTSDGGRHWRELGEPAQALQSVHFIDPDRGFGIAGLPSAVPPEGGTVPAHAATLVRTSDGGRTWQPLPAPCDAQSVCFTAMDDGWLVAQGRVYRSEDGGAHWRDVLTLPKDKAASGTVECAQPAAAWVLSIADTAALSHKGYVAYHSNDGGHNWNAVLVEQYTNVEPGVPAPQGPGSYPGPFSVLGPSEAVFVGFTPPVDYSTTTMLVTDGGRTLGENRPVPIKQFDSADASFVTRTQGWIVGRADDGSGLILSTPDGGRSWHTQLRL